MHVKECSWKMQASVTDVRFICINFKLQEKFHIHQRFSQHPWTIPRTSMLLLGMSKQTFRKLSRVTKGFRIRLGSECNSNSTKFSHSTSHLEIPPFHKGTAHHHCILQTQNKRQNAKRTPLQKIPRQSGTHLLCVTAPEPRASQLLGLSHQLLPVQQLNSVCRGR